jgi:hypothetical protein
MLNLTALFKTLVAPTASPEGGSQFVARNIPGFEHHRIAKDHRGAPALLIAVKAPGVSQPLAPIHLEHLSVLHNTECLISREDGTQEAGRFSVIRCGGNDTVLHSYFLRVLDSIMTLLGEEPSQTDVSRSVSRLVDLFRVMAEPARKPVQGLWTELFVIAQAVDPVTLLNAWHSNPLDIYDFNAGNQRLEVKSASGSTRQHHFSLAQLHAPPSTTVLIASVLIERAGAGVSLADLIEEIRSKLVNNFELLLRLDQIVMSTLGESWRRAFDARFDRELAEGSLKFYDSVDVPSVDLQLPTTVTDVHFKSDLTALRGLSRQQLRAAGGLFRAVLPR